MKDNSKADVSHTDEFDKMYQEMVKQAEDKYKVKPEYPETEEESKKKLSDESWRYKNIFDRSQYPQSFECPDGYIFKDENGNVINATKIVLEKKKKEYPKTYKECCKVLGVDPDNYLTIRNIHCYDGEEETTDYERDLLSKFNSLWELRICRDAYWKIAGEEMGLGKPWEPDWTTDDVKHSLVNVGNTIIPSVECKVSRILAFPTKEIRDDFRENFDPDIEICKEFL